MARSRVLVDIQNIKKNHVYLCGDRQNNDSVRGEGGLSEGGVGWKNRLGGILRH